MLNVPWDWNEAIYAVMVPSMRIDGKYIVYGTHGLSKNKEHAEAIAKEVGGYVEETGWIKDSGQ